MAPLARAPRGLPWKVFLNGSIEGRCEDGQRLAGLLHHRQPHRQPQC
jgi:hypothetical protein